MPPPPPPPQVAPSGAAPAAVRRTRVVHDRRRSSGVFMRFSLGLAAGSEGLPEGGRDRPPSIFRRHAGPFTCDLRVVGQFQDLGFPPSLSSRIMSSTVHR